MCRASFELSGQDPRESDERFTLLGALETDPGMGAVSAGCREKQPHYNEIVGGKAFYERAV